MARLFWLSDEAWGRIEPQLPHGQPGKPRVDDRRVISGILHVLKVGCRWQDTPSAYGPHTTIYTLKEGRCYTSQALHERTDRLRSVAGGERRDDGRGLPDDRCIRVDVLPLKK